MSFIDLLFGGAEGGGVADGLLKLLSGLLATGATGAADGLGAAASEGGFARFMSGAWRAMDLAIDAQIINDLYNLGKGRNGAMPPAEKENVEHIRDAVKSHAILRQQLEANKDKPGIAATLEKYAASGANIPSEDVTKEAYRKLAMLFHPDRIDPAKHSPAYIKEREDFFKKVKEAYEKLDKREVRAAYDEAIAKNPEGVAKIFKDLSGRDWEEFNSTATERLKIGFNGEIPVYSKAEQWVAKLSGAQKIGVAAAAIGGVSAAAYATAKIVDRNQELEDGQPSSPKQTFMGAANGALSGGLIALGGSAAVSAFNNGGKEKLATLVMKNIKTTYYLPIVVGTAAFAALGAVVRHSRARKHEGFMQRVQAEPDAQATR